MLGVSIYSFVKSPKRGDLIVLKSFKFRPQVVLIEGLLSREDSKYAKPCVDASTVQRSQQSPGDVESALPSDPGDFGPNSCSTAFSCSSV